MKLAWPLIGFQLLWLSTTTVDVILISHLGAAPLAALAIATTVVSLTIITITGVLTALSPLVAQAFGAGQNQQVAMIQSQGALIALFLAVILSTLYFFGTPLLIFFGQDQELAQTAGSYLRYIAPGLPAIALYSCYRHAAEATSDTRPSIVIAAMASGLNLVLDLGLIHGWFGLPRLGIRGAALATALVQWFMLGALVAYLQLNKRYLVFQFFRLRVRFSPHWQKIREILALGLPMAGALLAEMLFFIGATLLVGKMSTNELAAHQIALNTASLAFMMPLGLSFAVTVRIGQAIGRKHRHGVRLASTSGYLVGLGMSAATALLFLTAPDWIVSFYVKDSADPSVAQVAEKLLQVAALFTAFDGMQVLGLGMLRGLKDTRVPLLITIASYWIIGFPTCLLLGFQLDMGPMGVWNGLLVGLFLAAMGHFVRFQWLYGKLVLKEEPAEPLNVAHGSTT